MYCYCRDEFDWFMKLLEQDQNLGLTNINYLANLIDDDIKELRYMKKRFGYLFYNSVHYIKKVDGRNAIIVNREHGCVASKPEELHYHGIGENGEFLNETKPIEDRVRYDIKFLDEIDKGEPFISEGDKFRDEYVKETTNIFKKIKLIQPEIYNSLYEFSEVLDSEKYDKIKPKKNKAKFYQQVKKYVIDDEDYDEDEDEDDEDFLPSPDNINILLL